MIGNRQTQLFCPLRAHIALAFSLHLRTIPRLFESWCILWIGRSTKICQNLSFDETPNVCVTFALHLDLRIQKFIFGA
jgi:hypothetical protein